MAKLLRLRRGTSTQHTTFTGAEGEVTVNTTNDSLHVHDGTTAGGTELAKADLSNVDGNLSNNLGFGDNVKATFGASNDLEIYHNGSHSVIADTGTGQLQVLTNQFRLNNAANNENLIACDQDGNVQVYNDGAVKFATTSTGIDVTGTVTCDGLTSDGVITISTGDGRLDLKDSNNTGDAAIQYVRGIDSGNTEQWLLGNSDSSANVTLMNGQNGQVRIGTNNTTRLAVDESGHLRPTSNNAYDLGTSSLQWRDGYFDGTVYCDGLVCVGDATVTSSTGRLYIQDNDNTGSNTDCAIIGRDSAGTQKWYYGTGSGTDSVYLWNYANDQIQFGTNNTHRISLTGSGHLVPNGGNTYDLGDSTNRWRNVYTNDLNLSNEGGTNDVDGTWGSWTIQEGEDDLFLLNRRNGKKYKFNLSEVN